MVSFPKLLAVLSLAIASRMSKVLICLNLNRVFFWLTTLSPAKRGLGASSLLLARFSPIEQKYSFIKLDMSFICRVSLSECFKKSILHDLERLIKSSLIVFQESFTFPLQADILFEKYCFFNFIFYMLTLFLSCLYDSIIIDDFLMVAV